MQQQCKKNKNKKSIDRAAFTTHKMTCTQTVRTAGRPEDDSWRHRSISSVVSRLRFEVVHRLRRQVANCGRESIAGNIMPHPVTITVRCIRRIEHLITCKRKQHDRLTALCPGLPRSADTRKGHMQVHLAPDR